MDAREVEDTTPEVEQQQARAPRYQRLGGAEPDRLADACLAQVQRNAKLSVVPPPPAPAPRPPPPLPPAPAGYYVHRRHVSGRYLWHHQWFGLSRSADFRTPPETMNVQHQQRSPARGVARVVQ